MKLLLDENLPKRLKNHFVDHEIYTIHDRFWSGKTNGELLRLMLDENFDVLITFDKNLQFQQNFQKYTLTVFVLNAEDNRYDTLKSLIPKIHEFLAGDLKPGPIEIRL